MPVVVPGQTPGTPGTGTLTVAEIATRVKRQFGDEAGAQITNNDILRWLNDAMKDISINNNLLQVKATSPAVAGTSEYSMPTDILTLQSVKFNGSLLTGLSIQEADTYVQGHDSTPEATGVPTHYWVWASTINVYPTPQAVGTLMLYYTRVPNVLTLDTDVPEIPAPYHPRLVEYCIAQAYELDDNFESYQKKMQQFQDGMDKLKDNSEWSSREFYPSITVSAADTDAYDAGYW